MDVREMSLIDRDSWKRCLTPEMRKAYAEEGVIFIPQLLQRGWIDLIEQGIERNRRTPGPESKVMDPESPGAWFTDMGNYAVIPEFQFLLARSPIADVMQYLLNTSDLWLYYDQTFVKSGGENERTPWHQDLPYWLVDGPKLGSMWISVDPVPKKYCLEFVPRSHLGPQYGGVKIKSTDKNVLNLTYESLPAIPDIEADRAAWKLLSWDVQLGDVIVIHPNVLHGGGNTGPGGQRRTASFRFFGDDAVMTDRFGESGEGHNPRFSGVPCVLRPGDPFQDPRFPLIRSAARGR